MSLPAWNSNSLYNKYTDTYIKGVVDINNNDALNNAIICRTGNINLISGSLIAGLNTISNTVLGYLKNISSDIQQQVTNLAATAGGLVSKTQYIAYSGGTTTVSSPLAFTSTLNGILPGTLAYISTLTSSAQAQFGTLTSNFTTTNSNVTALTTTVNGHTTSITANTSAISSNTTNLTNITYNPLSTYTDMGNVYIGSYLISEGTTLKNTTLITGNLSVNSQSVSALQLGYLSGLSGDVQSAIDNLNTKTTGISAGGGGYTNIDFLDVTDFLYSATGSQLDGPLAVNGVLTMGTTASIVSNSLTISPTALSYLANVTSDIQTQINGISTSNFVTIGTSQTITGNKIFNGTVTLNNITASSIQDAALASTFVKTTGAVTVGGVKSFTGNCVFSNNPSFTGIPTFVNATFTGTAANSPTFASLYSNYLQIQSTAAGTGLIFNNGGSLTTAGVFLWSRYTTPTNPATQIGDMELAINQGASTNGLSIGISTATSNGIRLLPNSITFNSPIVITGNITSNSISITPTQLSYVSGATSNLQTQITSINSSITTHTTNITDLQTKTANIGAVGTITTIYNNLNIGNTTITGLLTLPTAYSPLPTMLQLGGSTSSSPASNGVIASATNTNVTSITIGNLGVFLLTWNITFKTISGNISAYLRGGVSSTSATFQSNNVSYSGSQNVDTTGTTLHGSTVFTNTSSSVTYYLVSYQSSLTSLNYTTNSYLQIVRIA